LQSKQQVVVIGGGISGLSTAFWLQQSGINVTILERTRRVGGVIRSQQLDGYTIDHAANCLMNFLPEVNYLCETVGLSEHQVFRQDKAEKRYMVKKGRVVAVPTRALAMLTSSYWTPLAKLRMLLEPWIAKSDVAAEESVADFIRRRFGHEMYERGIEPFIAGTLAGDAERVCAKSALPRFSELEGQFGSILKGAMVKKFRGLQSTYPRHLFSFKNGMEALPEAIGSYLGKAVHRDSEVQAIERQGQHWILRVRTDDYIDILQADAVIMATPALAAANLLQPLSDLLACQLRSIVYAPMAVLTMGFNSTAIDHPLDGIGYLVPAVERKQLLGSLWSSSLFAHRAPADKALITCYMGGMLNPDTLARTDEELVNSALNEMKPLLGVGEEPDFVRVIRHKQGLPQYHLGHQLRLQKIAGQLHLLPGLFLAGNYLDGVSVRDCIARGKKLADNVVQNLGGATDVPCTHEKMHPRASGIK